jgi:hypothetical protein
MHATLNATAGFSALLIEGGNDLTVGVPGLAGCLTMAVLIGAFYVYDTDISHEKIMHTRLGAFM